MGSLERRVGRLEEQAGVRWTTSELAVLISEALMLMDEQDVHVVANYVARGGFEFAVPSEDEEEVLILLEQRFQEVQTPR
jgi:hypothetical protein